MNQMTGDMLSAGRIAEEDFARIADLLHRLTGIYLTEAKRAMVVSRLGRRVKALGLDGLSAYVDLIHSPEGAAERDEMIEALTTNMTRFDREAAQFVHFAAEVMPGLATRARAGGRVRLWSAGCSSGEEPYSLSFRVLDQCPEAPRLDLRILATDIDRKIVGRAVAGRYGADLLKPLAAAHREKYFTWPDGADGPASVGEASRGLIAFRVLNLLGDWPFQGRFDVIMCRNVTIYFDAETQATLWRRFSERLVPGGILYIGHSEGVSADVMGDFEAIGAGTFRKKEERGAMRQAAPAGGDTRTRKAVRAGKGPEQLSPGGAPGAGPPGAGAGEAPQVRGAAGAAADPLPRFKTQARLPGQHGQKEENR